MGASKAEGSLPATDRRPVTAVADAALAGESVLDLCPQNRNDRVRLATLVGEDHRNAQVVRHLAGNRRRKRTDVAEQPVLRPESRSAKSGQAAETTARSIRDR